MITVIRESELKYALKNKREKIKATGDLAKKLVYEFETLLKSKKIKKEKQTI